ncbi:MAG: exosortase/archaeosortase family protein [Phycisphaerales bacterium]
MRGRSQRRTTDAALLVALLGLGVLATLPVWREIVEVAWSDPEQSHILLALPVAGWLAWVRRGRSRLCTWRRSLLGSAIIAAGGAMSILGRRTDIEIAWHAGAIMMLAGAPITVYGPDLLRRFLPAFGALAALMPVPGRIRQEIALPLQQVSAQAGEFVLDLFGVPITRSGNVLIINDVQVAVAEACNGMRMVAALALVTYAFVFAVPMRNSIRAVIVVCCPVIAVIANVLRLVPTTLFYGYADHETAELFHDISGWVVLAMAFGVLWLLLALLRWLEFPIAPYGVAEEGA